MSTSRSPLWRKWFYAIFSMVPQPPLNTEEISALWFLYGHCDRHRREEIEKGEKVVAEMWRTQRDIIEGLLRRLV
jgi:hypothetical protein